MTSVEAETSERLHRAAQLLDEDGVDLLIASPSADLRYLIGYAGTASDRPLLLILQPHGPPVLLVAQFEIPVMPQVPNARVVPYADTQNPYQALSQTLGSLPRNPQVAVTDQTWASVLLQLQSTLPGARFTSASRLLRRMRMRKSQAELALLADAGRKVDGVFDAIVRTALEGRTERDVAQELSDHVRQAGLAAADWGPIVASGPNAASPHHVAGDRPIRAGDAVVLDFGGSVAGYQADITRTLHVGNPGEEFQRVYSIVRRAQEAAVVATRAGIPAQEVDRAARQVIEDAGYGAFFTHRTGHGIGIEAHEEPYILEGSSLLLEPGMTFSIEPGIYLPGRFGVRIEDIVAVEAAGARRLNNATRELAVL